MTQVRTYGQIMLRDPIEVQIGGSWWRVIPQTQAGYERIAAFCVEKLGVEFGEPGSSTKLMSSAEGVRLIVREALKDYHPEVNNPEFMNRLLDTMSCTGATPQLKGVADAFWSETKAIEQGKAGSPDSDPPKSGLNLEALDEILQAETSRRLESAK